MRLPIRRAALMTSRISGVQRLFRRRSQGPTVLFYHGVEERISDPIVQGMQFPLGLFEKQMRFLRREREVISIDELSYLIDCGKPLDPRCVVLTFDDGYMNNFRIVGPMLNAWGLPFTIFVSTRHISDGRRFPMYYIRAALMYTEAPEAHLPSLQRSFKLLNRRARLEAITTITHAAKTRPLHVVEQIVAECIGLLPAERWAELDAVFESERPMSWAEVVRTTAMGATIGSHTHDHCILHSSQSAADIRQQVHTSKSEIEKHIGMCRYFAYPNGSADDVSGEAHGAVQSEQFHMAFSTILGEITHDCDRFLAPRIFAVPEYEEFCFLLNRSAEQNQYYRTAHRSFMGEAHPGVVSN